MNDENVYFRNVEISFEHFCFIITTKSAKFPSS